MRSHFASIASFATLFAALAAAPAAADDGDGVTPDDEAAAVAVAVGDGSAALRDLTTDRPDVTESPFAIDAGHIQLETTLFGYTRSPADAAGVVTDAYEFGTTNLRVGVTDQLELDVVWQPFGILDSRGSGFTERGIGSVDLRAKYNLWGNAGLARAGDTALALLPYVTLPTDGSNGIGEDEVAFGLIVPMAINLGGGLGLGLNGAANFTQSADDATYDAAVLTSASLAYEWSDVLGSYTEVVWEFSRNGALGDVAAVNTGLTLAVAEDWQLDIGVKIGGTRAADRFGTMLGISARF